MMRPYTALLVSTAPVVTFETRGEMGGTVAVLRGRRVLTAKTKHLGWRIQARGQVGPDARLHSIAEPRPPAGA